MLAVITKRLRSYHEGLIMHPGSPELMLIKVKMLVYAERYEDALNTMAGYPTKGCGFATVKIEALLQLYRTMRQMD